jgi:Uncharacterized protein conserved in bacteria
MLKQIFTNLVNSYDGDLSSRYWSEIVINYCDAGRYHHTLDHIESMYRELFAVKDMIDDWDTILFALFYHDIVYNTQKNNNEAESVELAKDRLSSLMYSPEKIDRCVIHILATKGHCVAKDNDTNLFTDADLSILGSPADLYRCYTEKIRKEYTFYPDKVYNGGRKKVLQHFLNMPRIYKTEYFSDKYEKQAHENLKNEIETL